MVRKNAIGVFVPGSFRYDAKMREINKLKF